MELKRDRQIKISVWVDNEIVADHTSEVFTAEEHDDTFYVYLKDPSGKEVKIKMEKSPIVKED